MVDGREEWQYCDCTSGVKSHGVEVFIEVENLWSKHVRVFEVSEAHGEIFASLASSAFNSA